MEFNDSSIITKCIQNLLYTFFVPTIRVLDKETYALPGETFILGDNVYRMEKIDDDWHKVLKAEFREGERLLAITKNLTTQSPVYDSKTHESLGNLLRFLRDYKRVNLLPLYNCFSNRFEEEFSLPITLSTSAEAASHRSQIITGLPESGSKVAVFPVKFGKVYHIYSTSPTAITVQCALYDSMDLTTYTNVEDSSKIQAFTTAYKNFLGSALKSAFINIYHPFTYRTDFETFERNYRYTEPCLYMFIKVPADCADKLVVIEYEDLVNKENMARFSISSNNSLLSNPYQVASAFSNNLIGYLLYFFISPLNEIPQNIQRVQKLLSSITEGSDRPFDYKKCTQGSLDEYTLSYLYNYFRESDIPDFIGFVDSTVEDILNKRYESLKNEKGGGV